MIKLVIYKGLLALSILMNVGLVYIFFLQGEDVKNSKDGRSEIKMSSQNREFAMAEMRLFLESIKTINEGLVENNPTKIVSIDQQSGVCKVDVVPQGLIKSLPVGFKTMGMQTHDYFDKIAKIAKENYSQKEIQKELNSLMNNCVACHRTYKITWKE